MRKRWQTKPNLSGLAVVAPTSEEARADGLYLMRDDLDPINLPIIAHDSAAAQDKPQVKLVKGLFACVSTYLPTEIAPQRLTKRA